MLCRIGYNVKQFARYWLSGLGSMLVTKNVDEENNAKLGKRNDFLGWIPYGSVRFVTFSLVHNVGLDVVNRWNLFRVKLASQSVTRTTPVGYIPGAWTYSSHPNPAIQQYIQNKRKAERAIQIDWYLLSLSDIFSISRKMSSSTTGWYSFGPSRHSSHVKTGSSSNGSCYTNGSVGALVSLLSPGTSWLENKLFLQLGNNNNNHHNHHNSNLSEKKGGKYSKETAMTCKLKKRWLMRLFLVVCLGRNHPA